MVLRMLTPELCTSFWRTFRTIPTWLSKNLFHNSLFRMKHLSITIILNQNNKACNGTNEISQNCHFITLCNSSVFFHAVCKRPTTAKIHEIFIAQKSYCACCVLNLATIRSKYYFDFILNRTRWGWELFDCPSYVLCGVCSHGVDETGAIVNSTVLGAYFIAPSSEHVLCVYACVAGKDVIEQCNS